jgi:CO dehydrogenase maturation factor
MTPVIAVAGKGGSGKTTLAALLVRCLLDRGCKPVLAVDADPNANLGEALGVDVAVTLGQTVEDFQEQRIAIPPGMTKEALVEMRFASVIEERKGFDLLTMGRGEGPGCYCSVNNLLRALVEKLTANYRVAVIDNEAGLEHLSRRTSRHIDVLLMISDCAVRGLRAALGVSALVDELGLDVAHRLLVVGRVPASGPPPHEQVSRLVEAAGAKGLELAGFVPHDEALVRADLEQRGVLALEPTIPALHAAGKILDKVLEKTGPCW